MRRWSRQGQRGPRRYWRNHGERGRPRCARPHRRRWRYPAPPLERGAAAKSPGPRLRPPWPTPMPWPRHERGVKPPEVPARPPCSPLRSWPGPSFGEAGRRFNVATRAPGVLESARTGHASAPTPAALQRQHSPIATIELPQAYAHHRNQNKPDHRMVGLHADLQRIRGIETGVSYHACGRKTVPA